MSCCKPERSGLQATEIGSGPAVVSLRLATMLRSCSAHSNNLIPINPHSYRQVAYKSANLALTLIVPAPASTTCESLVTPLTSAESVENVEPI